MSDTVYSLHPFMPLPNCANESSYDAATRGDINCTDFYHKVISLRVYFALIIINFIFITTTTALFIHRTLRTVPIPLLDNNNDNNSQHQISRQWQSYSLKKRGLFGPVLGALGHLVFSTFALLYQVIVTSFTCEIYLWGPLMGFFVWTYAIIWRTLRLHLLFRFNQLQHQFGHQNKFAITTTTTTSADVGDSGGWLRRHKITLDMSIHYQLGIFAIPFFFLVLVVFLVEALEIRPLPGKNRCDFSFGNYAILCSDLVFFVSVIPFVFWCLRHESDAHGIRQEIWVTMIFGIPCFVIFLVWQLLFDSPTMSKPATTRGIFGPSNWIIIVTTANHIMSIVVPVFKKLNVSDTQNQQQHDEEQQEQQEQQEQSSQQQRRMRLGLTTESLEGALRDPAMLKVLQTWAIKDFSVENVLFFDRYLQLEQQVEQSNNNNKDEIPIELVPEAISFYTTFIRDQAPLQVNISYEARKAIDDVLAPLLSQPSDLSPPSTSIFPRLPQEDKEDKLVKNYLTEIYELMSKSPRSESNRMSTIPVISLAIFETAKREVFWNIFSGLFPKVVAAYNNNNNSL